MLFRHGTKNFVLTVYFPFFAEKVVADLSESWATYPCVSASSIHLPLKIFPSSIIHPLSELLTVSEISFSFFLFCRYVESYRFDVSKFFPQYESCFNNFNDVNISFMVRRSVFHCSSHRCHYNVYDSYFVSLFCFPAFTLIENHQDTVILYSAVSGTLVSGQLCS
jgi:hypothetical protein